MYSYAASVFSYELLLVAIRKTIFRNFSEKIVSCVWKKSLFSVYRTIGLPFSLPVSHYFQFNLFFHDLLFKINFSWIHLFKGIALWNCSLSVLSWYWIIGLLCQISNVKTLRGIVTFDCEKEIITTCFSLLGQHHLRFSLRLRVFFIKIINPSKFGMLNDTNFLTTTT